MISKPLPSSIRQEVIDKVLSISGDKWKKEKNREGISTYEGEIVGEKGTYKVKIGCIQGNEYLLTVIVGEVAYMIGIGRVVYDEIVRKYDENQLSREREKELSDFSDFLKGASIRKELRVIAQDLGRMGLMVSARKIMKIAGDMKDMAGNFNYYDLAQRVYMRILKGTDGIIERLNKVSTKRWERDQRVEELFRVTIMKMEDPIMYPIELYKGERNLMNPKEGIDKGIEEKYLGIVRGKGFRMMARKIFDEYIKAKR